MLLSKLMILTLSLGIFAAVATSSTTVRAEDGKARFFELRIYKTFPGKLDALNKRFREHTNRLFEKHGMELVGYWTPAEGEEKDNTLIYVLAYPSREARDKSWEGFRNDPEWKKAAAESEANGKIVEKVESKFMTATDYSPIK